MNDEVVKDVCIMDVCANIVRTRDRDRYLATLFVPASIRGHLLALYAFDLELRVIMERVSDPFTGQMRLQWWHDAMAMNAHGGRSGNPVADCLQSAINAVQLPRDILDCVIAARYFDIDAATFSSMDELMEYFDQTFGNITKGACLILAPDREVEAIKTAEHAGRAMGLVWMLLQLPCHLSRGKLYLPEDMLARHDIDPNALLKGTASISLAGLVEELIQRVERHLEMLNECVCMNNQIFLPAIAHLASARLCLGAMRMQPLLPLRMPSPLRRQWRMWRFMRSPRL